METHSDLARLQVFFLFPSDNKARSSFHALGLTVAGCTADSQLNAAAVLLAQRARLGEAKESASEHVG